MKKKLITRILGLITLIILLSTNILANDKPPFFENFWDRSVDFLRFNSQRYTVDEANAKISKNMFYPVEDWEITVCSRDFSTTLDSQVTASSIGGGIYADTATVSAYVIYDNDTENPQHLYEVSWYYQPMGSAKTYSLYLLGSDGLKKYILKDTSADPSMGSFGYFPEYYSEKYNKVILKYGNTELVSEIVNKTR